MDKITLDRRTFRGVLLITQLEFVIGHLHRYMGISEAEVRDLWIEIEQQCWDECLQDPSQLKNPRKLARSISTSVGISYLRNHGRFVDVRLPVEG